MKYTCFRPTKDNWCGNYGIQNDGRHPKANLVELSVRQLHPSKDWRVSVWGNDDMGMEYDTHDKQKALDIYLECSLCETIEKDDLIELGFVRS